MNTKMMMWKRYARYYYPLLSFLCLFLGYPCWRFSVPFDRCFLLKQGLTFGKIPLFLWAWDLCNQFARSDWWGFGELWIQWVYLPRAFKLIPDPRSRVLLGEAKFSIFFKLGTSFGPPIEVSWVKRCVVSSFG